MDPKRTIIPKTRQVELYHRFLILDIDEMLVPPVIAVVLLWAGNPPVDGDGLDPLLPCFSDPLELLVVRRFIWINDGEVLVEVRSTILSVVVVGIRIPARGCCLH